MRLAKFLAHAGIASRRRAGDLVRSGRVSVDGERELDPARQIDGEAVAVDGTPVGGLEERVVYAINKPAGVVSTAHDTHGRRTVVELVDDPRRLYPVGRLDVETTGLILLTNDGELANLLAHPRHEVPKTYRARVAGGTPAAGSLKALAEGIELEDGRTAPATVTLTAPDTIEIELREGRKRQVRRMCEAIGHRVTELERIRFGPLSLEHLARGQARRLTEPEVAALRDAARR
ncbi:MAG TPA: pseudouridine synthase [Solirubrobacteraceae bacterium]|jgi:23S rRNA pseudouridine2605 synthase